ncbi:MAG: hypothetical protein U9R32_03525 [Bacteroidota bacterium]|nr:hypothetical protein [Bacteroidota bacterium]
MRKIFSLLFVVTLLFSACDPNKDIYDDLDEQEAPYSNDVDVVFGDNDYEKAGDLALATAQNAEDSARANAVKSYKNFNDFAGAAEFVPAYLSDRFMAYNKGSVANVTYTFYLGSLTYLNNFGSAESYELTDADYEAMGEGPGQYHNFSSSNPPEDYLPAFLNENYPDAEVDQMLAITYAYYSGVTENRVGYYISDGSSWNTVPNVYVLTPLDYDDMGAPGKYNNFSDDVPADNYLATFLELKYPYAVEGDVMVPVYRYYVGGGVTETRADEYHYNGSTWFKYEPVEARTSQFIHTGTEWVFDPTVRFEISSSDYQLIADEDPYKNSYGTGGYYYGADAHYTNFDLRISKRSDNTDYPALAAEFADLSEDDAKTLILTRMVEGLEVLLQKKYPDAVASVSGIEIHYIVSYVSYNNDFSRSTWIADMQCMGDGVFTLVDNTLIRDEEAVIIE